MSRGFCFSLKEKQTSLVYKQGFCKSQIFPFAWKYRGVLRAPLPTGNTISVIIVTEVFIKFQDNPLNYTKF